QTQTSFSSFSSDIGPHTSVRNGGKPLNSPRSSGGRGTRPPQTLSVISCRKIRTRVFEVHRSESRAGGSGSACKNCGRRGRPGGDRGRARRCASARVDRGAQTEVGRVPRIV